MTDPAAGSVRCGLLSTASIGEVMATAARDYRDAVVMAVASRNAGRAARFADRFVLAPCDSYDEWLASGAVDAVYVPMPIALHADWTVTALRGAPVEIAAVGAAT